jgi:hypothetical protein
MKSGRALECVASEFERVSTGDRRLDRRVKEVAGRLAKDPEAPFPAVFISGAEREAFYRLLRNERVSLDQLLEPHVEATKQRAMRWSVVVVAHDTTEIAFRGRSELYELRKGTYGFGAHVSLAMGFGECPHPLGVVATSIHPDATSNRGRWLEQALQVEQRMEHPAVVHVMDREADVYDLFAGLLNAQAHFVVRARHDRLLAEGSAQERTLREQLERRTEVRALRQVALSERRATAKTAMPDERKARPPRKSRPAQLAVRACTVTIPRPQRAHAAASTVTLNVVQVREVEPPLGVEPVEWLLVTREPIDTDQDLLRVMDLYCVRWSIEEYFKALKTGCAYEARQLEQLATLKVALGLFLPIAWQLLLIRSFSRQRDVPAHVVLPPDRQRLLTALCAHHRYTLPEQATARDLLLAIARLGGHIPHNGDPGWQVLWRGFKKLLDAEHVVLATTTYRSDQS